MGSWHVNGKPTRVWVCLRRLKTLLKNGLSVERAELNRKFSFIFNTNLVQLHRTEQNIVRYYSQVKQMYGATGFRSVDVVR